ncbi:protein of unknown function DUF1254 [Gloeothece citriformis PCC 7424]|uniref:DUF1254 domain-containing protein n=1 Tax=Gloeothece citriformis (strain PCC 7424) TaxID=65393 RepID=B7KJC6_GLOC7|nr:DUF1254 domain-containing protein [Gloeothece citriformis]ACK72210.1 protein of unknown function DUF1254 [Gloeothece citriformis PCC 7424]
MTTVTLSEEQAFQLGIEAYIYGYPLVLMEISRALMTSVAAPEGMKAPINQFAHLRAFPDASFTAVVSPNADTLYSSAWLDVSLEPIILSVPDTAGRYYLMPMLDAWTNVFASPGKRTTGTGKSDFAIVAPGWTGELPDGVQKIQSPTSLVWIIGRTQTNAKADYETVNAIQDQYQLTPLSQWGKPSQPPTSVPVAEGIDPQTPPVEQVKNLDATTFFKQMCALMKNNPPTPEDKEMVEKLAKIGIVPGEDFELQSLDPSVVKGLSRSVQAGHEQVVASGKSPKAEVKNNWLMTYDLGIYGTNYLYRAGVAWVGLGANLPKDAIYPLTRVDEAGNPLSGANRYVIHFDSDQIPPVNAFWSITMYNNQQFFVDNPLDRYAIGDRDNLTYNQDGSLDIYIQQESPGKNQESNWLPSPQEGFNLILRLYWPKAAVLDKIWSPPPVKRIS